MSTATSPYNPKAKAVAQRVAEATRTGECRPFKAVVLSHAAAVVQYLGEGWQQFIGVDARRQAKETAANLNRAYELGRRDSHREVIDARHTKIVKTHGDHA